VKKIMITIFYALVSPSIFSQDVATIRDFDLDTITQLGGEIYRLDNYGARATDILFNQGLNLSLYPIRGWIITEEGGDTRVSFVGEFDGEIHAVFDIWPDLDPEQQFTIAGGRKLTVEEMAQFKARQTANTATSVYCSNNYNSVVLKDPTSESWLVYLLAATNEPGIIMAGGHYRYTISINGESVQYADRLSRSCLTLNKNSTELPEGAEPVAMYMTHIVSNTPVETHIYLSLLHQMAFAISAGENTIWMVDGTQVYQIEQ